jgi:hypothetical protein
MRIAANPKCFAWSAKSFHVHNMTNPVPVLLNQNPNVLPPIAEQVVVHIL